MSYSSFIGEVIEAYFTYICQLKPNSISNLICFELLRNVALVVPTIDLFPYFFCICRSGGSYYFDLVENSSYEDGSR